METTEVRQKLERMKNDLLDRINRIQGDKKRNEPVPQDFEEHATVIENDEVLDALDEFELKEFNQINLALKAIDNGTYGTCAECGSEIGDKRLSALPFATKCIECV